MHFLVRKVGAQRAAQQEFRHQRRHILQLADALDLSKVKLR